MIEQKKKSGNIGRIEVSSHRSGRNSVSVPMNGKNNYESIQNAQKSKRQTQAVIFQPGFAFCITFRRVKESIPLQSSNLYSDLFYPLWLLPISSPFSKASLFRGSSLGFFPSLCSIVPHTTSGETTSVYPM